MRARPPSRGCRPAPLRSSVPVAHGARLAESSMTVRNSRGGHMNYLSPDDDYSLLSLDDLLQARDQFHLHLIHKPNVIGTAVGRYRIRKADRWPDPADPRPAPRQRGAHPPPRTLENSEVRPYSYPAILVFVERWIEPGDFAHPEDAVPPV